MTNRYLDMAVRLLVAILVFGLLSGIAGLCGFGSLAIGLVLTAGILAVPYVLFAVLGSRAAVKRGV